MEIRVNGPIIRLTKAKVRNLIFVEGNKLCLIDHALWGLKRVKHVLGSLVPLRLVQEIFFVPFLVGAPPLLLLLRDTVPIFNPAIMGDAFSDWEEDKCLVPGEWALHLVGLDECLFLLLDCLLGGLFGLRLSLLFLLDLSEPLLSFFLLAALFQFLAISLLFLALALHFD